MTQPTNGFAFHLPDNAPPEMHAVALLGQGLDDLRAAVAELAAQHHTLRTRIDTTPGQPRPSTDTTIPGPLRWDDLDRAQASTTWVWLINWTGWLVERYQLAEEIPACWAHHPPLIEELTALCAAWHAAYTTEATPEAPLRWLEALHRTRARLRDWDEHTRCRNGTHTTRRIDLPWPDTWRLDALTVAEADVANRPQPTHTDRTTVEASPQAGERP